jgi:hypothetical protein
VQKANRATNAHTAAPVAAPAPNYVPSTAPAHAVLVTNAAAAPSMVPAPAADNPRTEYGRSHDAPRSPELVEESRYVVIIESSDEDLGQPREATVLGSRSACAVAPSAIAGAASSCADDAAPAVLGVKRKREAEADGQAAPAPAAEGDNDDNSNMSDEVRSSHA